MSWVFTHSRAKGFDRLVLLAIADAANDQGGAAWPSLSTIAAKAGIDRRTVTRRIVTLEELGELRRVSHGGRTGVGGTSNSYEVVMPDYDEQGQSDTTKQGQSDTRGTLPLGAESPQVGAARPKVGAERPSNRPNRPTHPKERAPDRFAEFWSIYPKKADKLRAQRAWVVARKHASDDELIAGAVRYRDDPNRDPAFTKNASTWLNAGSWDNGPLPSRINGTPPAPPRQFTTVRKIGGKF